MTKKTAAKGRRNFGRPRQSPDIVRSKRISTFVTASELEKLERIVEVEQRSLSAVVYRMIVSALRQ